MQKSSIYSTTKLAHHPEALEKLRTGDAQSPTMVQWFPTNVCNQSCTFCAFGSGPEAIRAKVPNPVRSAWKNQQLIDTRSSMSLEKALETVQCLHEMGVKAVEVTGGGEPTAYTYFDKLWEALRATGMDLALVTNGTLLTDARIQLLQDTPTLQWVRVSIDAGDPESYVQTRHVPQSHYAKAWQSVGDLAEKCTQATVGVGFVVDRENWKGVGDAIRTTAQSGANNIRISAAFTPEGLSRFPEGSIDFVRNEILLAASAPTVRSDFRVHDLFSERIYNVELGRQMYSFCTWKEVGCLIGADATIYACCSLAYHPLGIMGSIQDKDFRTMWEGEGKQWRDGHDARKSCKIQCLYWQRNLDAIRMIADPAVEAEFVQSGTPAHVNFI